MLALGLGIWRVVGILARAQRLAGTEVHEVVVMSNHFHILSSVRDVEMQAAFTGYVKRWFMDEVQPFSG